jgi:hypothetical protein
MKKMNCIAMQISQKLNNADSGLKSKIDNSHLKINNNSLLRATKVKQTLSSHTFSQNIYQKKTSNIY